MGFITSGVGVVLGIVRSKLVAVKVGPLGVGIVAEVTQLLTLVAVIATVANSPALLKWISEAARDKDHAKLERGLGTSVVLALGLGLLATLGCVVAGPWLLPNDWPVDLRVALALSGVSIAFAAVAACITTVHVGFSDLKAITLSSLMGAVLTTASLVVLVWFFGLMGNFIAIAVGSLLSLLATAWFLRRRAEPVKLRLAWDRDFARQAFTIGVTSLISGYVAQGLLASIRFMLEHEGQGTAGAELNGNFQAAYAISTTYFSAVLQGVGQYYFPRYAAAQTADELTQEVRSATRFVMRLTPILVLLAISFRDVIIVILYSSKFGLASQMLGAMFASDILKAAAWSFAGPLPMRGRVRAFLTTEAVGFASGVPLYWLVIHQLGPQFVGVATFANTAVYVVVAAVIVQRSCGVRLTRTQVATPLVIGLGALAFALGLERVAELRWAGLGIAVLAALQLGLVREGRAWLQPKLNKAVALVRRPVK